MCPHVLHDESGPVSQLYERCYADSPGKCDLSRSAFQGRCRLGHRKRHGSIGFLLLIHSNYLPIYIAGTVSGTDGDLGRNSRIFPPVHAELVPWEFCNIGGAYRK